MRRPWPKDLNVCAEQRDIGVWQEGEALPEFQFTGSSHMSLVAVSVRLSVGGLMA